jgi:hypothetical protein
MVDTLLKYWQLVMIIVAIVGGAISGYIWLDEKFDGIDSRLSAQSASVDQISGLARSEELRQGFDQIGGSLERVRCELDALINAGDLLSAAEVADSKLRVLELEKRGILRRESLGPEEEDQLEEIRQEYNSLKEQRTDYLAEAQKYRRIIEARQCE